VKYFFPLILFFGAAGLAVAQVPNSFSRHDTVIQTKSSHLDSAADRINKRIDAFQLKANSFLNPDLSTGKVLQRVRERRMAIDSIKAMRELDSIKTGLHHKIDSLTALNLPTERYKHFLDSVNQFSPQTYMAQVKAKADELDQKVNKPLNTVEGAINEKLDLMRKEGGDAAILPGNVALKDINISGAGTNAVADLAKSADVNMPVVSELNLPKMGEVEQLSEVKEKIDGLKSIPQQQVDRLKSIDEVQKVQGKAGQANAIVDKAQAYQEDVSNIVKGDLGEVKEIPKAIESRIAQMDEMKDMQKVTGEMGQYQSMIAKGNDPEALKAMAKDQAVKYAKDHFLGKEAALMAAMDKLSKVKGKYPDVASLKDLPKRVPNQMKGKPLIERIVPGFQFQIQKSTTLLLDLSPTVGYRFAGRFTAGVGWNERLSFKEWNQVVAQDRIFGPRAFALFNLKKGFSLKAEGDYMNVYLPTFVNAAEGARDWVWSVFVGIQKDYTFYKNIRGNVQMLYNVYDDHGNSPYVDKFNVRMGWEFPMRKKKGH
jgi:hypothetical protein